MKQPFLFVLDNKFYEHDSLCQLKNEAEPAFWEAMTSETVEIYTLMRMTEEMNGDGVPHKDKVALRRLHRTLDEFRRLDPVGMAKFDVSKLIKAKMDDLKKQLIDLGQNTRPSIPSKRISLDVDDN